MRTTGKPLQVGLLTVLAGVVLVAGHHPKHHGAAPPNIVFILTDDLDMGVMAHFPELKHAVGDAGATFDNAFVSLSLCCPSRSSILRGQYAHNTTIFTNHPPDGGWQAFHEAGEDESTIGRWLHDQGYRTALFGKYLNLYPGKDRPGPIPPGWDHWAVPAAGNAYGQYLYSLNVDGAAEPHAHRPGDYLTDVLAQKSERFIADAAADGKPFFLWVAPYSPHQPATPAPRYRDAFLGETAPRPPSFDEPDLSDKPHWSRPRLTERQITTIDTLWRRRLQSMAAVQDLVLGVIDTLEQAKVLDNTYVVFFSDNGFHLGEHRLPPGKDTAFETDLRVPLFIRGPGIRPGQVIDQDVLNIDLAPTFAAMAGVATPDFVDGRSLLPLLDGAPPDSWRQGFLLEHAGPGDLTATDAEAEGLDEAPDDPGEPAVKESFTGVRTPRWKQIEWANGTRELYDLQADPYELDNQAATAVAGPRNDALAAWIQALRSCAGPTCRDLEDHPPTPIP